MIFPHLNYLGIGAGTSTTAKAAMRTRAMATEDNLLRGGDISLQKEEDFLRQSRSIGLLLLVLIILQGRDGKSLKIKGIAIQLTRE